MTAYPQRLSSTDPNNWTFDAIYTAQGDLRTANGNLANAINLAENVRQDPNASLEEIQAAIDKINIDIRFHFGSKAQGDEVVARLKGILNSDGRTLHPLFFDQGDARSVNVQPTITGTPLTPGEINDYRLSMQDLEQNIIPFARSLQSQAKAKRAELEAKLRQKAGEQDTVEFKNLRKAVAEKDDDTGTGEGAVGTNEGGSVKTDIDSDKEKTKVTARAGVSEDGSVGNANANSTETLGATTTGSADISDLANQNSITAANSEDKSIGGDTVNMDGITYPNAFFKNIVTKPNPLLQFAHYTYRIGLYLQTPNQYTNMMLTGNKDTSQLSKILESGGTGAQESTPKAIFPDLYIDDIELESLMMGNTGGAHNAVAINFNIIEPMGFRFLDQLRQLCTANDMYGFSQQHYLMVITFTGYDEDGAELTPDNIESMTKYIPFKFVKVTTTVRTGSTQYACECVPPAYSIGQSIKRSKIRFNVELAGRTLNDIFNAEGGDPRTDATAPRDPIPVGGGDYTEYARRNAAAIQATKTSGGVPPLSTQGVIKALNKEQIELVKKGVQSVPDEFKVTFMNNIGNEKVVKNQALQRVKKDSPMNSQTTQAKEATQNTGVDLTIEKFSSVAGMSVMQFIDLMIRASSYITKQQNYTFDEKTKKLIPSSKSQETFLQWFNIATVATPIAWDEKRNDYAYRTEYIVSPKKINDVYSSYFDQAKFRGTHKKYTYWFTGENTEVIDFEQELNASFYVAMDNKADNTLADQQTADSDEKTNAFDATDSTSVYNEPADRAAGIIYSPVDFARSIMTIFGDPDYIQQNEVFFRPGEVFDAFLPDGSVNTESNEVLYELFFRTQNDYDDNTGEAILQTPELTANRLIYRLIRATTRFAKGQMTQELEGLIREFEEKNVDRRTQTRETTAEVFGPPRRQSNTKKVTSSYTQNNKDITDQRYPGGGTIKRQKIITDRNDLTTSEGRDRLMYGSDDDPRLSVTSNYNQPNPDRSSYGPVNNRVNRKQDTEIIKPKSIRDDIFGDLGGA